jgi:hypothetical protein
MQKLAGKLLGKISASFLWTYEENKYVSLLKFIKLDMLYGTLLWNAFLSLLELGTFYTSLLPFNIAIYTTENLISDWIELRVTH